MIRTTGDKRTKQFLEGKRVKEFEQIEKQAWKRLRYLNQAKTLAEIANRPANRFHWLKGNLKDFCAISINNQYRITVRWDSEQGDAYDVRITDYR
jgi:proteic killer suppression protein